MPLPFAQGPVGGLQLLVDLPEIREDDALNFSSPLRLVQSMDRSVLNPIKNGAEDAEHPREYELARRILP